MSEKTAWEKYKEKNMISIAPEAPIVDTKIEQPIADQPQYEFVDPKIYSKRLLTCIDCPAFVKESKTCTECGCFMVFKTKLPHATCPLNKWEL